MNELPFYIEELSPDLNSYELKMFRIQHDETQLTKYLCKLAKEHQTQSINKTFLVREKGSKNAFLNMLNQNMMITVNFCIFLYKIFIN